MKSERETLFQFVVRANGGYTFCVLRVLVGVVVPTFAASRPPHGWGGEFACGAVASLNIALFVIVLFAHINQETAKICDELIEMVRKDQQKQEQKLVEFYESRVPKDTAHAKLN